MGGQTERSRGECEGEGERDETSDIKESEACTKDPLRGSSIY